VADLSWYEILLRVGAAAVLGAVLGAEREADGHEAGLRTHLLLSVGAGLFGLISVGAFDDFYDQRSDTNFQVDVTRVASYVAAGVGFLGAGAILKHGTHVKGLTTAASLWATAAIGLAAGLGFWIAAVATTGLALVSLLARPVKRALHIPGAAASLVIRLRGGAEPGGVLAVYPDLERLATRLVVAPGSGDRGPTITVELRDKGAPVGDLAGRLAEIEDVEDVSVERRG